MKSLGQNCVCRVFSLAFQLISGSESYKWAENQVIALNHIQPGKPQLNAYVERYNRTVRHEWLDQCLIESLEEAQEFATQWLWTYNNERPNMGIGRITPAQKLKMAAGILLPSPVKNGGLPWHFSQIAESLHHQRQVR
jgi:transposase InsO family protein